MGPLEIKESAEGCAFPLKVIPRSPRNGVVGIENGVLKIKIQAPPVEGAANEAVIAFLAGLFKKKKSNIAVILGKKSRHKVVRVLGIKAKDVLGLLQKQDD